MTTKAISNLKGKPSKKLRRITAQQVLKHQAMVDKEMQKYPKVRDLAFAFIFSLMARAEVSMKSEKPNMKFAARTIELSKKSFKKYTSQLKSKPDTATSGW